MANVTTEDYLKAVLMLEGRGERATTSALAAHLDVADASVTDMVKKLSSKKLLRYRPYRGVELTGEGHRLAIKMMRRHRLWEMFLTTFLGYTWDEVHDEAERLEHVTSEKMEYRLDQALGFPKLDPHGDPIPTAEGKLDATVNPSLDQFTSGDRVEVLRVSDANPAILQHASKLGLRLNTRVSVKEKLEFDGSMRVKIGTKEQFISKQIAGAIFVKSIG